jgi:outer membrane biosynthesis protein TonB
LLAAVAIAMTSQPAQAQANDSAPAAQTPKAAANGEQPAPPPSPPRDEAILSDTQGVDFSPYMRRLHSDIQRNWTPRIPKEVQAPQLKKGVTGIRLTILPDGRIGSMKLETRSGDITLDKAAWYAITDEGQFPPLPAAFHGPQLELRIGFFYNTSAEPADKTPSPALTR